MVSPNGPGGYTMDVADAGLVDLESNLAKACHVALYGVLFDFNKSILQPSSEASLQPVTTLMAAVLTWVTPHGVAAETRRQWQRRGTR